MYGENIDEFTLSLLVGERKQAASTEFEQDPILA
jgi:hypothetical protein